MQRFGRHAVIRIGTRGSKLALWQAGWVKSQLTEAGYDAELVIITTSGDVSARPLSEVGGQGLFTKEIQRELLAGRVDVAVHSLKDLPTLAVPTLVLAAVPERETTQDCLVSRSRATFEDLPAGSRIGTGSSRRQAQLRAWRSDIEVLDIRGNVDSRLQKLYDGEFAEFPALLEANDRGLAEHPALRHSANREPHARAQATDTVTHHAGADSARQLSGGVVRTANRHASLSGSNVWHRSTIRADGMA